MKLLLPLFLALAIFQMAFAMPVEDQAVEDMEEPMMPKNLDKRQVSLAMISTTDVNQTNCTRLSH